MSSNDTFDEIEVSENHIIGEQGFADHTEYEVHTGMADEYRVSEQLAERVHEQYGLDLEEHSSEQSAIACDRWETQRENARAISLWVRRVRLADRCGVETARDIDEVAQLPPADGEAIAAPPASSSAGLGEAPHEILEISADASDDVVKAVARRKSANVHPEGSNPDTEEFKRVQKAKEEMLDA